MSERVHSAGLARYGFLIVILGAFLFRLSYLLFYSIMPDWQMLTVDNYFHHHWAETIANGNLLGDTTYFRAPLYIWCLGLLYKLFGTSWWVGRLFGALVGSLSAGTTWLIGKRFFSGKIAIIAAVAQICYPIMVYHDGELLTDSLFTLLFEIALYVTLLWLDERRPRFSLTAGMLLGLSALARPTSLVLIPLILLFAVIQLRRSGFLVRQLSLYLAGIALVVGVTLVRNLIVADDPVSIASQGGINFYIGNNPDADGVSASMPAPLGNAWEIAEVTHIAEVQAGRTLKPGEVSSYWFNRGMEWIQNNPGTFIVQFLKKCYWMVSNIEIPNQRDADAFLAQFPFPFRNPLSFGLIFAFALWGIFMYWKEVRVAPFLSAVLLLFTASAALFFVNTRFRLPLLPIYFIFSSAGLLALIRQITQRSRILVTAILIIAVAGLVSYLPLVPLPVQPNVQALRAQTSFALNEGNIPEAITTARQAVMIDTISMNNQMLLGIAFLRSGNRDSAVYHLEQEVLRHPGNEKGHINLASAQLASGEAIAALQQAQAAIAIAPYDITANQLLIRALAADSTIPVARLKTLCDTAMLRTGQSIFVAQDVGALLAQRGEIYAAMTLIEQSLAAPLPPIETDDAAFERNFAHSAENIRRERAQLYFQLGFLNGQKGEYRKSIQYSRMAIGHDPMLRDAYLNLISGYLSQRDISHADSVLQSAHTLFPDDSRFRLQPR